jgi:hypothetical protein
MPVKARDEEKDRKPHPIMLLSSVGVVVYQKLEQTAVQWFDR